MKNIRFFKDEENTMLFLELFYEDVYTCIKLIDHNIS